LFSFLSFLGKKLFLSLLGNKKSSFLFCLKTTKKPSVFLAKTSMYQKNIEIRVVDALFCFELSKKKTFFFAFAEFFGTNADFAKVCQKRS